MSRKRQGVPRLGPAPADARSKNKRGAGGARPMDRDGEPLDGEPVFSVFSDGGAPRFSVLPAGGLAGLVAISIAKVLGLTDRLSPEDRRRLEDATARCAHEAIEDIVRGKAGGG